MLTLTADHRIDSNLTEQARVCAAGGVVSTVDRSGARCAVPCVCEMSAENEVNRNLVVALIELVSSSLVMLRGLARNAPRIGGGRRCTVH